MNPGPTAGIEAFPRAHPGAARAPGGLPHSPPPRFRPRRSRWLLAALCACVATGSRAEETQLRTGLTLRFPLTESVSLFSYAELGISDRTVNPSRYLLRQGVTWQARTNLSLQLNHVFSESESFSAAVGHDVFRQQQRVEAAVTPSFTLGDRFTLNARTRLEHRWLEGQANNLRTRHRFELEHPAGAWLPAAGFFHSYEFFFDWSANRNSAHRVLPAGISWEFGPRTDVRAYYYIERSRGGGDWENRHVFFTQWSYSFR